MKTVQTGGPTSIAEGIFCFWNYGGILGGNVVSCRCRWTKGKLGKQRYDMQESTITYFDNFVCTKPFRIIDCRIEIDIWNSCVSTSTIKMQDIFYHLNEIFLGWTTDEYDAPSQSRSEIQSGDYIPLHRRWKRVKSQRLLPPNSILVSSCSSARACKT